MRSAVKFEQTWIRALLSRLCIVVTLEKLRLRVRGAVEICNSVGVRASFFAPLHHLTRDKFVALSAERCQNLENADSRNIFAPLRHLTREKFVALSAERRRNLQLIRKRASIFRASASFNSWKSGSREGGALSEFGKVDYCVIFARLCIIFRRK